ncbi:MAG TPA: cytochrome c [Chitinophagaceae bacterium]|jgi:nitrite reductase (NO-forming)|nr:cytochrome c [Chitinophagaceae bacterium]
MKYRRDIFITGVLVLILFTQFTFKHEKEFDLKASIKRGKEVYIAHCISCHMENGQGIEGLYPPVAKADYLMANKKRSIQQVLYGATGEMKVNGKIYNVPMAGTDLTDEEASDVLNYTRNSWGNKGGAVTPADVKAARNK